MKMYLAIYDDRHADTTAHPFIELDKAIEWAKKTAEENCRHKEDIEEKHFEDNADKFVYMITYRLPKKKTSMLQLEDEFLLFVYYNIFLVLFNKKIKKIL